MRNRDTNDALAFTGQYIYNNIDKYIHIPTASVFMDLAKTFRTVNDQMLLEKLWELGVWGVPRQLIQNYITNNEQCVKIFNLTSKGELVKVRVPQGTILGPLLFIWMRFLPIQMTLLFYIMGELGVM